MIRNDNRGRLTGTMGVSFDLIVDFSPSLIIRAKLSISEGDQGLANPRWHKYPSP